MRNTVRNSILVLLAVLISAWAVIPPDRLPPGMRIGKLTKGKDLAGGATLTYGVGIKPGDPGDTLSRVIQVLKERVDPTGQLEISMVPQGADRIEITMPLPSEHVKDLRKDFDNAIAAVSADFISSDDLQRFVLLPADQRPARAAELVHGDAARQDLLLKAGAAYDAMIVARATFDAEQKRFNDLQSQLNALEAEPPEVRDQSVVDAMRTAVQAAKAALEPLAEGTAPFVIAYENARDAVLASAVPPKEMRAAVQKSKQTSRLQDPSTRKSIELASPRSEALAKLKKDHPGAAAGIDKVVAAWETYERERQTLDDPSDLIRLLRGAGVLNFRITPKPGELPDENTLRLNVSKVGPRNAGTEQVKWFKINKIENWYSSVAQLEYLQKDPRAFFAGQTFVVEPYEGEYYMLCYDTRGSRLTEGEGAWRLTHAGEGVDPLGRPAIDFAMDAIGASKLGALTEANVNNNMAVILDDEVYTAPVLHDRISNRGQISGGSKGFSKTELEYIIRVLSAGSLQAKLSPEPISTSIVGPTLGKDNLARGLHASYISFIAVSAFMILYYFICGTVSVIALGVNALLLVGALALQHAPFTLPGIAGVALTFGIAVDANVLIYERMREELMHGADAKTALRLGYHRALASIVDGNLTNLIPCIVLGFMGTQEIKGFAITLGIGVVTTLFSQLFVTRLILTIFVEAGPIRKFRMLPIVVPAIHRALSPNIDWIGLRFVFIAFSTLWAGLGIVMIGLEGKNLLDTEFRGGTAVTIQLKEDPASPPDKRTPLLMKRLEIEERIKAAAARHAADGLGELGRAAILVVNPQADGVTSSQFTVKTVLTDATAVQRVIVEALGDTIDSQPQLRFDGSDQADAQRAPVFPILDPILGKNLDKPALTNSVGDFYGGAAILLDTLEPPTPLAKIEARLAQARSAAPSDVGARPSRIIVLDGSDAAVRSAVLVVGDSEIKFLKDETQWRRDLAAREWVLVRTALTEATTLANVQNFGSAVARTFRAQAIVSLLLSTVAIVIYVWVRFNSLRYSIGAIVSTLHDCLVAIGMVAIAGVIFDTHPDFAKKIGLLPFKFDLNLVASVLTILGYSINDTIIVMDRIREMRGKLPNAGREMINEAINKTISRTVITSGTAFISSVILYVLGGEGVRSFAFALIIGIVAGTYSSFAVAAPIVWVRKYDKVNLPPPEPASSGVPGLPARSPNGQLLPLPGSVVLGGGEGGGSAGA